jgi:hydrogenase maturation protease
MTRLSPRILVIGYGNPGRLDDGLGPALAAALEPLNLPGVTVDADYQLTVETAAAVAEHDLVIFADASVAGDEPFFFQALDAAGAELSFSTHSVEPEAVLALCEQLFAARPRAYVLGIRGYEFDEFGERLSEAARANLTAAVGFLARMLRETRCWAGQAGSGEPAGLPNPDFLGDTRCNHPSM